MASRLDRGRRALAALTAMAAVALARPAGADEAADELARRHFESAAAYLEESDYDNALKAFEKACELSRRPEILLNIATVDERLGDWSAAISGPRHHALAHRHPERPARRDGAPPAQCHRTERPSALAGVGL